MSNQDVLNSLLKAQTQLLSKCGGLAAVPPGKLHFTLALLRLTDEGTQTEQLREALSEVLDPVFDLELCGLDLFKNGRVVFAKADSSRLNHLAASVRRALPVELEHRDREFNAHCTLFKGSGKGFSSQDLAEFSNYWFGFTKADSICVMQMSDPEDPKSFDEYRELFSIALPILEANPSDLVLEKCFKAEIASFPPDEAATLEGMQMRRNEAGNVFCHLSTECGRLIGFVNGTATTETQLTHQSMEQHEPNGKLLCIHSVTIVPDLRLRGLGIRMFQNYVEYVQRLNCFDSAALICKTELIQFYKSAGFKLEGQSSIVHGKDPWYEMTMEF